MERSAALHAQSDRRDSHATSWSFSQNLSINSATHTNASSCGYADVPLVLRVVRPLRRISTAVRQATALPMEREFEALGRLDKVDGLPKPIEIKILRIPRAGHLGTVSPIWFMPQGGLGASRRQASRCLLASRMLHLRRHDNRLRNSHVVEVFRGSTECSGGWDPLGRERDRACDEEVWNGQQPPGLCRSILKICEVCVGSPRHAFRMNPAAISKRRLSAS